MTSLRWFSGRSHACHVILFSGAARRARRTARVLRNLDDHLLADIGIERDQIEVASRSAIASRRQ